MEKIRFEGTIITSNYSIVAELIEAWLGEPSVKIRTFGEEIVYKDDKKNVYAYNPVIGGKAVDEFVIEGNYNGELEAAHVLLKQLAALCKSRQIEFDMEYVLVDEDNNLIGDSYTL